MQRALEEVREAEVELRRGVHAEQRHVHLAHERERREERLLDLGLDRHLAPRAEPLVEAECGVLLRRRDAAQQLDGELELDAAGEYRLAEPLDLLAHVAGAAAAAHCLFGPRD